LGFKRRPVVLREGPWPKKEKRGERFVVPPCGGPAGRGKRRAQDVLVLLIRENGGEPLRQGFCPFHRTEKGKEGFFT